MQNLEIDFFGLAIFNSHIRYGDWNTKTNESTILFSEVKTPGYDEKLYLYLVLDLGRNTKKPLLLWSMNYTNSSKVTVKKLQEINTNCGKALLVHQSKESVPGILKILSIFKMKCFGNKEIPFKYLTKEEWQKRYKDLDSKYQWNKLPDL